MEELNQILKDRAASRFQALAGVPANHATELVQIALLAAQDQVLEAVAGSGAIPSTMTALRAELLYHVCLRAKRVLEQREVEVLFRAVPVSARTILATMRATYRDAIHQQFADRMRTAARVEAGGTDASTRTWTLTFSDPSDGQTAWDEVQRLGLADVSKVSTDLKEVTIPQSTGHGGKSRDPLAELGLEPPTDGRSRKNGQRSTRS